MDANDVGRGLHRDQACAGRFGPTYCPFISSYFSKFAKILLL